MPPQPHQETSRSRNDAMPPPASFSLCRTASMRLTGSAMGTEIDDAGSGALAAQAHWLTGLWLAWRRAGLPRQVGSGAELGG